MAVLPKSGLNCNPKDLIAYILQDSQDCHQRLQKAQERNRLNPKKTPNQKGEHTRKTIIPSETLKTIMIKLIIFDAGGVLYKGSQKIVDEAIRKFLKKHGITDLKKSSMIWSKIGKRVTIGKITLTEAHEKWLEGIGLSKTLVDEWAEVDRKEIWGKFQKTPGINKLLKKLKKKYILAVLTDTIESQQEKIEKMKIVGVNHKGFDEIFTSHDLGTCKPSKKAFNAPLKKIQCQTKRNTLHRRRV